MIRNEQWVFEGEQENDHFSLYQLRIRNELSLPGRVSDFYGKKFPKAEPAISILEEAKW